MINDYTLDDLYRLWLDKQFYRLRQIVQESRVRDLKQFAREGDLPWYQGSKASFLTELKTTFAHRRVITGDNFRESKRI